MSRPSTPTAEPASPAPERAARAGGAATPALPRLLLALARPHQWAKSAFVVVGPAYGTAFTSEGAFLAVAGAVLAFGFASSACYVVNDLVDRAADRAHPRKRHRPIASGAVAPGTAAAYAAALLVAAAASVLLVTGANRLWLVLAVLAYVMNALAYDVWLKHLVVLDVVSLALGFVLRVLGGCAAVAVPPSSWLLNCVFFLAMFLAFGKRLGERRTMREAGGDAASARAVQEVYTDDLLRMATVVTGVACLVTYAGYVQAQHDRFTWGFNLLWLTILPATYGLLRSIVLLERGEFDDPTELAAGDRAFQAAVVVFAVLTGVLMLRFPGVAH